jgi:amylosucrase
VDPAVTSLVEHDVHLLARAEHHHQHVLADLGALYGESATTVLIRCLEAIRSAVAVRPADLVDLDRDRLARPDWFQQPSMLGYACYVDRFAGRLADVVDRLDLLSELGVTYLHLMPLLMPRAGENDGGYAVADYRRVDPRLGDVDDLRALCGELRGRGISPCVDLVMNHTAAEHPWAMAARGGNAAMRERYFFFPDRSGPDRFEPHLREIFPTFKRGSFTWLDDVQQWVWTTFHEFQWDLDWSNPDVFVEMLDIMLFLANLGVEVLRLDAVPFLWKQAGTSCENLPEAHAILRAMRRLLAIAVPAVILKAEAIVPPDELVPYLGASTAPGEPERWECDIAYHSQLMPTLWSSLATGEARLMTNALARMAPIPAHAGWASYVRCHDDIGWAITDADAASVGWDAFEHRRFLNDWYSGAFPGSFALGAKFQENLDTGDARISGSAASLCGIEQALQSGDELALDLACARLELLYSIVFTYGGIPLVWMGDELALRNDHGYLAHPALADDNRWMHRPFMDWGAASRRSVEGTLEHRVFGSLRRLAVERGATPALYGGARIELVHLDDHRLFCFRRRSDRGLLTVVANFGRDSVVLSGPDRDRHGLGGPLRHGSGVAVDALRAMSFRPFGYAWLD